jgi:hypothetical protein
MRSKKNFETGTLGLFISYAGKEPGGFDAGL